jgi:hypothetical protein
MKVWISKKNAGSKYKATLSYPQAIQFSRKKKYSWNQASSNSDKLFVRKLPHKNDFFHLLHLIQYNNSNIHFKQRICEPGSFDRPGVANKNLKKR